MKKILCLISALTIILMGFCGCSLQNNTAVSPKNSVFESVNESEADTKQDINKTTAVSDSDHVSDTNRAVSSTSALKKSKKNQNSTTSKKQTTGVKNKKQPSDSKNTTKDKYKTDPVPDGKPQPAEPEEQKVDTKKSYTCTVSIECSTILKNMDKLDSDKVDIVPKNGVILAAKTVTFNDGESVYDVLQKICKKNKIHMEASWTPMYNSAYIEGIGNLYEFDCGSGSGWEYCVNGWYPNYGCSRYKLKQGDKVEWRYTCNLGKDIGGKNNLT